MKKPMVIVAAIGLVIVAALGYLLFFNPSDSETIPSSSTQVTAPPPVAAPDTVQTGKYVDYAPGVIEQTEGTKILFFHAEWCPQCRALEADIRESGLPEGVTVIKVDFDNSQDLREKYGVTLQTTLVKVDDAGNLEEKFVAYQDPSVASLKENLL